MGKNWQTPMADVHEEVYRLREEVTKLREELHHKGILIQHELITKSEKWMAHLTSEIRGTTIDGKLRRRGSTVIIHLRKHWREIIEKYHFPSNSREKSKSFCAAICLDLGDAANIKINNYWTEYITSREASDRERWTKNAPEIIVDKQNSMISSTHTKELQEAICNRNPDTMIPNPHTMLCTVSINKGNYLRIHLSKAWSEYLIKAGLEDNLQCKFNLCSIITEGGLEDLKIPMRCHYVRYDEEGIKGMKIRLPKWFSYLTGADKNKDDREYYCKIINIHQYTEDEETPNSFEKSTNMLAWKRRNGRNELSYPGNFQLEKIPAGEGMVDIMMQL